MALTGSATSRIKDRVALLLTVKGSRAEIALSHREAEKLTADRDAVAALQARAAAAGIKLPDFAVHLNRDKSWAIRVGPLPVPRDFVWPEDEEHEPEIPDIKPPDPGAIRPDSGKRK